MNPYPQRAGNAFGIRPNSSPATGTTATPPAGGLTDPGPIAGVGGYDKFGNWNAEGGNYDSGGNWTNTNPAVQAPSGVNVASPSGGASGATSYPSVSNPAAFGADGQGGNRAARNNAIQGRAAAANTPIARGYSDIMSDPANVQWNQRMLSDPLFARDQMSSQWATQGKGDSVPGGPVTGTGPMGTSTVPSPTNPYGPYSTGVGSVANPATPSTTSTGSPTGSGLAFIAPGILANGQAVNTGAAGSSGGSSSGSQMSTPNVETQGSNSQPPPTVTMPTNSASYQMPTVQAAQTPRNNVLNAMMRRFDPRGW